MQYGTVELNYSVFSATINPFMCVKTPRNNYLPLSGDESTQRSAEREIVLVHTRSLTHPQIYILVCSLHLHSHVAALTSLHPVKN